MNRLVVYGDSYVSHDYADEADCWPNLLAGMLKVPIVNKGISGSSTEYSFKKFIEDWKEKFFKEDDVVIFQLSTVGRLHLRHQMNDDPGTASRYWGNINFYDPQNKWFLENKDQLEWLIINLDLELTRFNQQAYIHVLRSFAELNPGITLLVISNPKVNLDYPIAPLPPNMFFPTGVSLQEITYNEVRSPYTWEDWTRYTKFDSRVNHLTNPNLEILARLAYQTIVNKTIEHWTLDSFEQNNIDIIRTYAQYIGYVDTKVIPFIRSIAANIEKNG